MRLAPSCADPGAAEQEMLELMNRMRADPTNEDDRILTVNDADVNSAINFFDVDLQVLATQFASLTPSPPLAWNELLCDAALGHSQQMLAFDEQSHQLPGEPDFGTRVNNAGYPLNGGGENVFAFAENVFHSHAAFAIDWGNNPPTGIQNPPGHRNNFMSTTFREVGFGLVNDPSNANSVGPLLVTHDFGNRSSFGNPWLLGVVFADADTDGVYDQGEGLSGVTVQTSGAGSFNTTTFAGGGFQMQVPAGNYAVNFSGGALAAPANLNVVVGSSNVKLDHIEGPPAIVHFSTASYAAAESSGVATITVQRSGNTTTEVTVNFLTTDGSATQGDDYTNTTGTLTFAANETSKTFTIPIVPDVLVEGNETVTLTLNTPTGGAVLGTPSGATLTVSDTLPATIQFTAFDFTVSEFGVNAVISVSRTGNTASEVTVNFSTADAGATQGSDYTTTLGTLTFAAGQTVRTFTVPILDDGLFEGNETVLLALDTPVGIATLGAISNATLAIIDNDSALAASFTEADGDVVSFKLGGLGTMQITGSGATLQIALQNTDAASSSFSAKVKKGVAGDGFVNVAAINVTGGLKGVKAAQLNLTGAGLNATGFVAALAIRDVLNGADITTGGAPTQFSKFTARDIQDGTAINWGSGFKSFAAARLDPVTINASSMGSLTIRGDAVAGIPGDLEASIGLTGAGVLLGKATLGKVTVLGAIRNTQIVLGGSVGTVVAAQMINSLLCAGYVPDNVNDLFGGGTFTAGVSIKSVSITGVVGTAFTNSTIIAPIVGSVRITSAETANGGTTIGVLADVSVASVNITTPAFVWNAAVGGDQSTGDFHVTIL